jgi:hypothetical protein
VTWVCCPTNFAASGIAGLLYTLTGTGSGRLRVTVASTWHDSATRCHAHLWSMRLATLAYGCPLHRGRVLLTFGYVKEVVRLSG